VQMDLHDITYIIVDPVDDCDYSFYYYVTYIGYTRINCILVLQYK